MDFTKYNYVNNDVYIAGDHSPIIYDWHAFGNKKAMNLCLSLYDNLGAYINEGRVYLCNTCHYYSNNNYCSNNAHGSLSEITLSPEYHLFKIFKLNGIKINNSGYSGHPYRYQDSNDKNTVDEIIKNLNINALVTSYTAGNDANEYIYNKK